MGDCIRKGQAKMVRLFILASVSLSLAAPVAAAVCYTKSDGAPSAFDTIDAKQAGSISLDTWSAYYGQRYSALPPAKRQKTTKERYLKYAAARFKGLDKDRSGSVTCAEYKASIERMKARRLAKAQKPKPSAGKPAPRTR
jgi:hypothetical protein